MMKLNCNASVTLPACTNAYTREEKSYTHKLIANSYKPRAESQEPKAQSQEPKLRAREGWKIFLGRLADLPVGPERPKLSDAQVERIAGAFAVHPVEVFNAVMDRADRYGDDPEAQLAASLDLEVLRWGKMTGGMTRTRAWQVVVDLIAPGGGR